MNPFDIQISGKEKSLQDIYINSNIYLYPYARFAFLELLDKLKIKTIYLPSFICRDMLAPINSLNIKYFFYEVNKKLEPILENIKCDAIIMVNYFGFAQKLEPFIEYKNKFQAIIIEDNAHGLFSKDSNKVLLGLRGDVGLLSIRKTIFLPNGAALLINSDFLKERAYKSSDIKDSMEDNRYDKKLRLKKKFFSKYIGVGVLLLRRFLRYVKTGSAIPLPDEYSEKNMPENKFLTPILKDGVLPINLEMEIDRRIKSYKKVEEYGKKFGIQAIYSLDENCVPFEFAFIDEDDKSKSFEKYLLKKGFFILPWPDLPDEVIESSPTFYKNIKVVPFLW